MATNRDTVSKPFVRGVKTAFPIAIGYFPMAISFGVIAVQSGIPLLHTVLMSLIVYAGASQFMAANMLLLGVIGVEIVLATLVINLRHMVMGMSLMNKIKRFPQIYQLLLSLGITDETFALASLYGDKAFKDGSPLFLAGMMFFAYSSWVAGTLFGGMLAAVIPASIGSSMSIALYAMFIGLLVPAVRDNIRTIWIALSSALLSLLFSLILDTGWAIVFATVLGAGVGIFLGEED